MDFDKTLRDWDRRNSGKPKRANERFAQWIDAYPPDEKTLNRDGGDESFADKAEHRRRIRGMAPQRTLDLHGSRVVEAEDLVNQFIRQAANDGLEKVLIIHGKGNHSERRAKGGGGVLKEVVYRLLREQPLAAEMGVPERNLGGSGAVWVALRYRSR